MFRTPAALAVASLLVLAFVGFTGCGVDAGEACEYGSDCISGFYCFAGSCRELPSACSAPVTCESCPQVGESCRTFSCAAGAEGLTVNCT